MKAKVESFARINDISLLTRDEILGDLEALISSVFIERIWDICRRFSFLPGVRSQELEGRYKGSTWNVNFPKYSLIQQPLNFIL
ncbi:MULTISPECIES: hypothetical protein [unclassified Okeania]|uniref:Uncharacterized protein n=1 Tax=Okeania hirsuta TaxID=1458930 RepID=A0A3N6PIM1_9CYAN|nr:MULTISPECIES: hypothetical protein [unclassified Okeania]NET12362.1 hypothetical protein [Okeania sp. SIO1H6]NET20009.1 hypothetical protein [Okeania sp. SIO1H5]RQH24963.1 hypothetical protein D4Z78_03110 [Okeania hirsuta]NET75519.1 hypothetical protein [Okeania sp. SIO1F9]NET91843.1 hypothetical protein [Okeania sp. SIO1H2]